MLTEAEPCGEALLQPKGSLCAEENKKADCKLDLKVAADAAKMNCVHYGKSGHGSRWGKCPKRQALLTSLYQKKNVIKDKGPQVSKSYHSLSPQEEGSRPLNIINYQGIRAILNVIVEILIIIAMDKQKVVDVIKTSMNKHLGVDLLSYESNPGSYSLAKNVWFMHDANTYIMA